MSVCCCQEASEQPDLYGIRRSGRQRKEVTRLSLGTVSMNILNYYLLTYYFIFCFLLSIFRVHNLTNWSHTHCMCGMVKLSVSKKPLWYTTLGMAAHPYCNQSVNARFVRRRYTTRSGAPSVVSYKHDQKVHSWVVSERTGISNIVKVGWKRRLDRSRRSHILQILFLLLAERKPLSQSVSATGCRNCGNTVWKVVLRSTLPRTLRRIERMSSSFPVE